MSVPAAYLGVILIWSTTPLAIQWSSEGWGFLFGVTGRMVLGSLLCLILLVALRLPLPWHRVALRTYLAAGLGIYGAMVWVYWGAQFVPSGVIAVLFGLTPIVTGLMARYWLPGETLSVTGLFGMLLGLAGLALVFGADLGQGSASHLGVAAILISVLLHSVSSVWVKRADAQLPALTVTTGALLVVTPLYLLTWLLVDGRLPESIPLRAGLSLLYLGVFGSVIGFVLYFYVLRRMDANRVALITLITPVCALLVGATLNGEQIDAHVWAGTALILAGLAVYQWGGRWMAALVPR